MDFRISAISKDSGCEYLRKDKHLYNETALLHKGARDSPRESNVVAGRYEQTSEDDLQDHQLAKLQSGAEAARITDRLVRSLDALGSHSVGASRPSAGL